MKDWMSRATATKPRNTSSMKTKTKGHAMIIVFHASPPVFKSTLLLGMHIWESDAITVQTGSKEKKGCVHNRLLNT
jgi:hypothetical protein